MVVVVVVVVVVVKWSARLSSSSSPSWNPAEANNLFCYWFEKKEKEAADLPI